MSHMRQQIRDYVKTGMMGLTTTGSNVFIGRTRPLGKDHPDTLLIYTRSETGQRIANGRPPLQERPVKLFLEGRVVATDPPDDLLDLIALEIDVRMATLIDYSGPKFFGGLVRNVQYVATETTVEAEGTKHHGGIRLEYLVTYRVAEGVPDTPA
jgi:hypothetical protein